MPAIAVVGVAIGLPFTLAYLQVAGRTPRKRGRVRLRLAGARRPGRLAGLDHARRGRAADPGPGRALAGAIPDSDRALVRARRDGRVRLAVGRSPAWWWCRCSSTSLAYIPYLQLGHAIADRNQGPGYGWSLDELQSQMFGYHFGLQAGHPAASPWWSWPLDLKPVWFYSHSYDNRLIAVIYNGGNPILFWAGVPALIWCGILAWRRRSLALVLMVAAFAFQFLPWTRIERATFQYHYLTAVIFAMVAVAYVVDEGLRSWAYRSLAIAFLVAGGDRRAADLPARVGAGDARLVRQRRARPPAVELRLPVPQPADRQPRRADQPPTC